MQPSKDTRTHIHTHRCTDLKALELLWIIDSTPLNHRILLYNGFFNQGLDSAPLCQFTVRVYFWGGVSWWFHGVFPQVPAGCPLLFETSSASATLGPKACMEMTKQLEMHQRKSEAWEKLVTGSGRRSNKGCEKLMYTRCLHLFIAL